MSQSSDTTEATFERSQDLDDDLLNDLQFGDSFDLGSAINRDKLFADSPLSVIGALAILFSWFTAFPAISKEAFGQLLHVLHKFLLPAGNILPSNYKAALAMISSLLVPVEEYHCCVNDCLVFRGENKHLIECCHCHESRYEPDGTTPRKRFKYLPLGPQIRRYSGNAQTSQLLQNHSSEHAHSHAGVQDIHNTSTWKDWYSPTGIFQEDSQGLALGLCADGTNPFSKEKTSYSMWPIVLSILNFHSSLRRHSGHLQLVGIIPGRKEPKNTDPYLQILVDELHHLQGASMYDAYQHNSLNSRHMFFYISLIILARTKFSTAKVNSAVHCMCKFLIVCVQLF